MPSATEALIVIDVQNDFCPGGALAVPEGDLVVGPINVLMDDFPTVVLSQDWHPTEHSSFAATHPGKAPFETVDMPYGEQVLWPEHCVQGSEGAEFHPDLRTDPVQMIVRKGFRQGIDSYSAFFENDRTTPTGLHGYLQTRGVKRVVLCGLATDFCVNFSALDAMKLGYETELVMAACRGIDLEGSLDAAMEAMRTAGVSLA